MVFFRGFLALFTDFPCLPTPIVDSSSFCYLGAVDGDFCENVIRFGGLMRVKNEGMR